MNESALVALMNERFGQPPTPPPPPPPVEPDTPDRVARRRRVLAELPDDDWTEGEAA